MHARKPAHEGSLTDLRDYRMDGWTVAIPRIVLKEAAMITIRHMLRAALAVLVLTGPTLALSGCERNDGPAEKAGEAVDDAVDDAKDALD
jgi:hypothetical protein